MKLETEEALRRAGSADHGVLATLHESRGADLVPTCFVIDGEWVAIPVDDVKPKGAAVLGRVRNLARDPRATLLVERWDAADWDRLWWVRLHLRRAEAPAELLPRLELGLRARYPQYAAAVFVELLTFRIELVRGWSAS